MTRAPVPVEGKLWLLGAGYRPSAVYYPWKPEIFEELFDVADVISRLVQYHPAPTARIIAWRQQAEMSSIGRALPVH